VALFAAKLYVAFNGKTFRRVTKTQPRPPRRTGEETGVNDPLPRTVARPIQFQNCCAIGLSNRWREGQYCTILTEAGIVGCGIYDVKTAAEFGQAVAIARGTPEKPLVEPEDLFEARIVDLTPRARELGVEIGMTGREAVERLLAASHT
jgi:uncharacterized protein YunC (DUF1805 family)